MMSKREPLSSYSRTREYGTFNSVPIYDFILTDPFFDRFVNSEIRGLKKKGKLKKCLDIENEGILHDDLECLQHNIYN